MKFWNFTRDENGERVLRLEGPIDSDDTWGDEVTPRAFREELNAGDGNITVWINSPGGSVFAASEIYTMLCDYKGKVTVKIDALAASVASVIAMAGDRVLMSPTSMYMIHDPMTMAMGNAQDMEKVIETLNAVKEAILNAYVRKTGLSRAKVAKLMSDETWMDARKAVELGFADEIMFEGGDADAQKAEWGAYSSRAMGQAIINRLAPSCDGNSNAEKARPEAPSEEKRAVLIGVDGRTQDGSMPYELLEKQLEFLR